MESLHDAVGGASKPQENGKGDGSVASEAERLHGMKQSVEAQLDAYYSQLEANNCDMDTPLVDPEGYPRSDIDVATVRTARAQIIRLRNDLKRTIDDMAALLERGIPSTGHHTQFTAPSLPPRPFARVREIVEGSPAAHANLMPGDEIVRFGEVNATNHANLQALAALVQRSEGHVIPVSVLRNNGHQSVVLSLTPHTNWGGRGSLGCHIVPI